MSDADDTRDTEKLDKRLGLLDVFAISTGAMFSSGFFLLPGVAAGTTGPSVFLAYGVASLLILPAMFSIAELSTAMPRAGGAYYFLDRALGPMAGTVGGLGTWIALSLKSAFALIGMGAYVAIFYQLPIQPVAIALTVGFGLLNIMGAKETAGLQRALVVALITIMTFYVIQGVFEVLSLGLTTVGREQLSPFFPFGASGFLATVGTVFVSFAGLTKVASVSEEIKNPDRNIPLGMGLSLLVTTAVYVLGVFIMVAVLPPDELRADLTPVATAGDVFLDWLPGAGGVILVVIAAVAAFASTGNAGILAASRYPLAMARDKLIPDRFGELGSRATPTFSIIVTCATMIAIILLFDVEEVAKLASAFQLLIFALLNVAVIVMRESRISTYLPGYLTPMYPWMQIVGAVSAVVLIVEIGLLSAVFTSGLIGASIGWYLWYGQSRSDREGAIYHLFARLGQRRFDGLDIELREIMKEREPQDHDHFASIVAASIVLDIDEVTTYEEVVRTVAGRLSEALPYSADDLATELLDATVIADDSISNGVALPDLRLRGTEEPVLVLARLKKPVGIEVDEESNDDEGTLRAILFLVSPMEKAGRHLRLLSELVSRVDEDGFLDEWLAASDDNQLREVLLRHQRYISLRLLDEGSTSDFIGRRVRDIKPDLPPSSLIALIRRDGGAIVPHGDTTLVEHDQITIIGDYDDIRALYSTHGSNPRI